MLLQCTSGASARVTLWAYGWAVPLTVEEPWHLSWTARQSQRSWMLLPADAGRPQHLARGIQPAHELRPEPSICAKRAVGILL